MPLLNTVYSLPMRKINDQHPQYDKRKLLE